MRFYEFRGEVMELPSREVLSFKAQSLGDFVGVLFRKMRETDVKDLSMRLDFVSAVALEVLLDPENLPALLSKYLKINGFQKLSVLCLDMNSDAVWMRTWGGSDLTIIEEHTGAAAKQVWMEEASDGSGD